jgi:toxin ParE1/3/4
MPLYTNYITPTADRDLTAAIEYYNLQAEDPGYRFADLVEGYVNRIALTPTPSAVRYRDIRCKPMATFPYLIMFTIDEPKLTVNILRFFHTSQQPRW